MMRGCSLELAAFVECRFEIAKCRMNPLRDVGFFGLHSAICILNFAFKVVGRHGDAPCSAV
jgi:hypothetical protein